jgi:hypothetical protein
MAIELGAGESATDKRTYRLLYRLTEWATAEGIPLRRELILDPDTVERFVQIGLARDRSASTYRAILRSVAPKLTKQAPWEPRPVPIVRRHMVAPYTASELLLLYRDALDQPTERRRRAARAFFALGLGAGLDGRWVSRVGADDVEESGGVVTVRVGDPAPRAVVVRAPYEEAVLELAATAGDEFLIGGLSLSANRTGHLVASFIVPTGHPPITPARLRSTWLLAHLTAGTRLPELCQAAGLQGPAWLGELLDDVPPLAQDFAFAMLRGTEP